MINFFPTMYEDELFVSAICRYRMRCGYINVRSLERDIFGTENVSKSTLFPMKIEDFVQRLPTSSKLTVEEIIHKHTLFPYFTAFLSEERTNTIFESMKYGNKRSVETQLGFPASPIKPPKFLKYCPTCFQEDLKELGESFWRRIHQIPGVFYCLQHETLLKKSDVLIIGGRIDYRAATNVCDNYVVSDNFSKQIKVHNLKYVKAVSTLLNSNLERKSLQFLNDYYIDCLRDKGYTSKNGNVQMKNLITKFKDYYHDDYLRLMKSEIDADKYSDWFKRFFVNTGKNRSPLRHLLVQEFLSLNPQKMSCEKNVKGRVSSNDKSLNPKFNLMDKRKEWERLIQENPDANRADLKRIGKGLHTWIRKYDLEWYEEVTPRVSNRKERKPTINYQKRDEESLLIVKEGYRKLMSIEDKPIRITPDTIRKIMGASAWIKDHRLVKTRSFLDQVYEEIDDYRVRKIRWAIKDMEEKGLSITSYKVQLHAGFGGRKKGVRKLIDKCL
ncbi:TnsD family Tn7-like transposition protein [Alkalibacillus haloalkaliphilus]|uniref:TnsD family Tn7-like transposition protein n=1 Tax=Alkalibacillus haloalkaliphilus TaxID=94136 RepID=UPI0029363956|nr:TnsD family Tn7-like transposition protein [Alkalibacillus haloalkaliphilus]MDV2581684.1 TnsD family Tn7-like transposition protein [Alkalibacillus haloalkaliphilus]